MIKDAIQTYILCILLVCVLLELDVYCEESKKPVKQVQVIIEGTIRGGNKDCFSLRIKDTNDYVTLPTYLNIEMTQFVENIKDTTPQIYGFAPERLNPVEKRRQKEAQNKREVEKRLQNLILEKIFNPKK